MPFLSIEGGEGSGKDTQIDLLKKRLDPERTVFVREPGGTAIGEVLRGILLSTSLSPETEMLLFLAARAELVQTIIRPALQAGKLVVANRFGLSTIAYQIYGRRRPELLDSLVFMSKQILYRVEVPYCILLDIDPCLGLQRVESRGDGKTIFDAERIEFHERVREGFLRHYDDGNRGVCINATGSIEEVSRQVARQMKRWNL